MGAPRSSKKCTKPYMLGRGLILSKEGWRPPKVFDFVVKTCKSMLLGVISSDLDSVVVRDGERGEP